MADIGSLVVKIAADTAQFQADLGKSARFVERHAKEMKASFEGVANFVKGGFALAVGVAAVNAIQNAIRSLASLVSGALETASALQGLSEQTGASVQALARFAPIATISGTSMEAVADTLVRLSKGMSGIDEESAAATTALRALGIEVKDSSGALRDPAEVLNDIALKLSEFEDGAGKTAIALDLFGKSGAKTISFLKDLAENQDLNISLTREQIEAADDAAKALARMKAQSDFVVQTVVTESIPAFGELFKTFARVLAGTDDITQAVDRLRQDGSFAAWAQSAASAAAILIDALRLMGNTLRFNLALMRSFYADFELLGTFLFGGKGLNPFSEENQRILQEAIKKRNEIVDQSFLTAADAVDGILNFDAFSSALDEKFRSLRLAAQAAADLSGPPVPNPARAVLNYNNAANAGAALATAQMEAQLKGLERLAGRESQLLRNRQRLIDLEEGAGVLSVREANERRLQAQGEFLSKMRAIFDEQEKVIDKSLKHETKSAQERLKLQEKLAQIADKREQLEGEIAQANRERAIRAPMEMVKDLQEQAQRAQLELTAIEEQIKTQRETRAITEIESLRQLGDARVRSAELLSQLAQQAREVAQSAPGNEKLADAFLKIEQSAMRAAAAAAQLRLRALELSDPAAGLAKGLQDVAEEATQVGKAIENTTRQAFNGMTEALANFVMTGKLSFSDLARSIIADLIRISIRSSILGPIANGLGTVFGSMAGSAASGTMTYLASGGVMSADGPLPLRRYSRGGIASTPQLALFGEGSRPEAYVPLPDGRTIPVTLRAASSSSDTFNITVQVSEAGATTTGSSQTGRGLGQAIASAVRQELLNQRRAGGLLDARNSK